MVKIRTETNGNSSRDGTGYEEAASEQLSNAGKQILASRNRTAYDTEALNVLKDRQFLSRILKDCVSEFKKMNPDDIAAYIEDARVSSVPIEPGLTNSITMDADSGIITDAISGMPAESKIIGESVTGFDILFSVRLPKAKKGRQYCFHIIVDVEVQQKEFPGYNLGPRMVVYGARMISAQMGREIKNSEYDSLQKVYTIWLVMTKDKERANTMSSYKIRHKALHGTFRNIAKYDYFEAIQIRLPHNDMEDEPVNQPSELMKLLSTLLSARISGVEKLERMNGFGIKVTEEVEGRIRKMCNLGDGIFEDGFENGRRAERANTKKESARADRESARADRESARADRAEREKESAILEKKNIALENEKLHARIAELESRLAM